MASLLRSELGQEVKLEDGAKHEFAVLVDGKVVAKKWFLFSPSDKKVIAAVKASCSS